MSTIGIMCQQEKYRLSKQTFLLFWIQMTFKLCIYKQISSLFTKRLEWTYLYGRHVLPLWQGIMGFLVFSPPRQYLIRCACPRYAVPVLDTLSHYGSSLSLSSTRCACPRYAVPVLNTLSWPFAVPVPLRNRILTLIPLHMVFSFLAVKPNSWAGFQGNH